MPEQQGTATTFYNSREALRYSSCHQTLQLQVELTNVALQLLDLPVRFSQLHRYFSTNRKASTALCLGLQAAPQVLLDLGCGSGMSGKVVSQHGHVWFGCDISPDMLALAQGTSSTDSKVPLFQQAAHTQQLNNSTPSAGTAPDNTSLGSRTGYNSINHKQSVRKVSNSRSHCKGVVLQTDMAQGIPVKANSVDGAISISAVQWLCHGAEPETALGRLFRDLYRCLKPECKAVLQVYLTGVMSVYIAVLACCMPSMIVLLTLLTS